MAFASEDEFLQSSCLIGDVQTIRRPPFGRVLQIRNTPLAVDDVGEVCHLSVTGTGF